MCSKRYQLADLNNAHAHTPAASSRLRGGARPGGLNLDWTGRSVYPHDAEDIKAHKWFRDIPWDRLHLVTPPFVPQISSMEDTHYFNEEEPISDWSESQPDTSSEDEPNGMDRDANPLTAPSILGVGLAPMGLIPHHTAHRSPAKIAAMHAQLYTFPRALRTVLAQHVATPYDSTKLKRMHREIEGMALRVEDQERMKEFVRCFGRKERKRPRDRLLRDRATKGIVLEVRKQSAFLGYTWRRIRGWDAGGYGGLSGVAGLEMGCDGTAGMRVGIGMGAYRGAYRGRGAQF